jgi:hypothetical protein
MERLSTTLSVGRTEGIDFLSSHIHSEANHAD